MNNKENKNSEEPKKTDTSARPSPVSSSGNRVSGENNQSNRKSGDYRYRNRNTRNGERGGFKREGGGFFRPKKECFFSKNYIYYIDYKNIDLLKRFLGKNGRILPRKITGTKLIYQRKLAIAVKRARFMGLLPFTGSIWSQDYYEQQNKEYLERKRQNQMKEGRDSQGDEVVADVKITADVNKGN